MVAPFWGTWGKTFISKGLQQKGEISFYQVNSYEELKRRVKEISVNGQLSPLGNLEGVRLLGLFERQMEGSGNEASLINLIWAPFSHPNYVRSLELL